MGFFYLYVYVLLVCSFNTLTILFNSAFNAFFFFLYFYYTALVVFKCAL